MAPSGLLAFWLSVPELVGVGVALVLCGCLPKRSGAAVLGQDVRKACRASGMCRGFSCCAWLSSFCNVSGCAPGFAVRVLCFCAIIQKYIKKSISENFFIFLQPRRAVFPAGNNKKAAAFPCAPCRAFLGVLRRSIIVRSDFVYCDFAQITRFANALILWYNINNQKGAPLPRGRWRVEYTGGQDWRPDPVNQF